MNLPKSYPFINRVAFILATRIAANAANGIAPSADVKAALRVLRETMPDAMPSPERVMQTVLTPRPLRTDTVISRALKTGADPSVLREEMQRDNTNTAEKIKKHYDVISAVVESAMNNTEDDGDPLCVIQPLLNRSAAYAINVHSRRISNGNARMNEKDIVIELNEIVATGSL